IGRGSYNAAWWDGALDDVQLYARALNDAEITTLGNERPTLSVSSPNGGEVWKIGSEHDITWVVDDRVTAVKLETSCDNATTWQTIIDSTAGAAGRFGWTVPNVESNQCRVRVSPTAGGAGDASD